MDERIEPALERAYGRITGEDTPPGLRDAIRHALFPGGHRYRPMLCHAVADSIGGATGGLVAAGAVALEFVHTASLIQDDLSCFDDAWERRGRPSVARAFGEANAILASDSLIAGAFEALAAAPGCAHLKIDMVHYLSRAIGSAEGLSAGQGWETEPDRDLAVYHRAKTAALFEASSMLGAIAAGAEAEAWRDLGYHLGMAYQMADDLDDAEEVAAGRPNALSTLSASRAASAGRRHLKEARRAVPAARRRATVLRFIDALDETLTAVARDAVIPLTRAVAS